MDPNAPQPAPDGSRWRPWLLALCAFCAAVILFDLMTVVLFGWTGRGGWYLDGSGPAYVVRVFTVDPTGPAARAGIHTGDTIDVRSVSPQTRLQLVETFSWLTGSVVQLPMLHDGRIRHVSLKIERQFINWNTAFLFIGSFWIVAFAAAIARRGKTPEAQSLALFLAGTSLGMAFFFYRSPWMALDLTLMTCGAALSGIAGCALVHYSSLFGRPLSRPRVALTLVAYAAAVVFAFISLGVVLGIAIGWPDPVTLNFAGPKYWLLQIILLACLFFSTAAARGEERQRIAWVTIFVTIFVATPAVIYVEVAATMSHLDPNSTYAIQFGIVNALNGLALMVMAVGLTYAALRRRVLDVGFALNRAAVFAGVSFVVIAVFVAVEWSLNEWFASEGRAADTTANLAVALALGFSIRFIHARVDRFVDRVFFRQRHENEAALRRFGREAPFVTKRDALIAQTVATIQRHAEADAVDVLLAEDDYAGIDPDDPALVATRASREPVDLHRYRTCLSGEYAFPMIALGSFVGAIVCGRKRGEESYAPDEVAALNALAQGVGDALESQRLQRDGRRDEVLDELRALRRDIRAMAAPSKERLARKTL